MISAFGVEHGNISKADSTKRDIVGTAAGAVTGQTLYQTAGYGSKRVIRSSTPLGYAHNKRYSEIKNPKVKARKKTWEKAKKAQAKRGLSATDPKTKPEFWRTLPKEVHGAKVLRTTGWTHAGKAGVLAGAAATAGGAGLGHWVMKETKK